MARTRLSALDASFLSVESSTAPMHVGWVALFGAPEGRSLPSFKQLREHIEPRLARAPRYRQKLAPVPFNLHAPEWVDDESFCVDRHVYWAPGPLGALVDEVMSTPLRRDRPLWEMWICRDAEERRLALIGKAHHCMVDGLAAVELGSLLLDPTPEPAAGGDEEKGWNAAPIPGAQLLLARGVRDLLAEQLGLLSLPLRTIRSPLGSTREAAAGALRVTRALTGALREAPASTLNRPLSSLRTLAWTERPLAELREIKQAYGTTLNDVMLAAVASGVRSHLLRRGERPVALKAMVPVSVRSTEDVLGNHISFVFAELPCEEPDPVGRLYRVHAAMSTRKRNGEPQGADLALKAAAHTLPVVQQTISRLLASPRTFNLVASNIPGPAVSLYMLGCPLRSIYPVVPLADRHAVSVGMTTIHENACFGIYADPEALPDADRMARDIDAAIAELASRARSTTAG